MSETTNKKTLYRNWFPFQSSKTSLQKIHLPSSRKSCFHPLNTTPSFSQETVWFHFDSAACYQYFLCQIVWSCQKSKPAKNPPKSPESPPIHSQNLTSSPLPHSELMSITAWGELILLLLRALLTWRQTTKLGRCWITMIQHWIKKEGVWRLSQNKHPTVGELDSCSVGCG